MGEGATPEGDYVFLRLTEAQGADLRNLLLMTDGLGMTPSECETKKMIDQTILQQGVGPTDSTGGGQEDE